MTLTGSSYTYRSGNVKTEPQSHAKLGYVVFTDAISPRDDIAPSTGSQAAAALAEQSFHDFFEREGVTAFNEEILRQAFSYVNQRVLELFGSDDDEVAVSAIVVAEAGELLIAGVGDATLFAVRPGQSEAIFFDPQTPRVDGLMTAEERHLSLHNAIGTGEDVDVHVARHTPATFERYVAASYGFLTEAKEEAIREVGAVPEEAVNGVLSRLAIATNSPHAVSLATAATRTSMETLVSEEPSAITSVTDTARRSRERKLALALSGVTCALVLFVAFQIVQDDALPDPTPVDTTAVVDRGEMDEDSWVLALKEQLSLKEEKIEELTNELRRTRLTNDKSSSNDPSQTELAERNAEVRRLTARTNELSKKLAFREESIEDLEITVSALEERLSSPESGKKMPADLTKLRKLQHEANRLRDALAEKEELLQSTRATNRDYAARYRKLEGQLTSKLDELSSSFDKEQEKQASMRHDLAERIRSLTTQLNEQMGRNRTLTAQLHEAEQLRQAQPHKGAGTTAQIRNELASVKAAYEQEHKRNRVLKEELQAALNGSTDGQAIASDLIRERATTTALKQELSEALAKLEKATVASDRSDETAALERKLRETTAALETKLEEATASHELRVEELSAALEAAKNRNESLVASANREQSELQQVKQELDKTLRESAERHNSYTQSETTIAQLKRRAEIAEQTLTKTDAARKALLDDKASLMDKIVAMEQFQELYQQEKAKREEKEREFTAFARTLEEQKTMLASVENARSAMSSELQKMRREYNNLLVKQKANERATASLDRRPLQARTVARSAAPSEPRRTSAPEADHTRLHIVSRGETLTGISMRYYGSSKYWTDIYNANQSSIADTKRIKVGTPLVIPEINEIKQG